MCATLSPRMRGWSWCFLLDGVRNKVIPANAGVILTVITLRKTRNSYPRECGGDPVNYCMYKNANLLSPRMRGWSQEGAEGKAYKTVIPANAGVILKSPSNFSLWKCYPRECGGDPCLIIQIYRQQWLSPRMRGWSLLHKIIVFSVNVIPANAGVILNLRNQNMNRISYPRECGGDPTTHALEVLSRELSPRMRGWS